VKFASNSQPFAGALLHTLPDSMGDYLHSQKIQNVEKRNGDQAAPQEEPGSLIKRRRNVQREWRSQFCPLISSIGCEHPKSVSAGPEMAIKRLAPGANQSPVLVFALQHVLVCHSLGRSEIDSDIIDFQIA
jgi:hypothetical protein